MSGFLVVTWRGGSPMTEEQSADTEDPANLVVEEVRIFDFDVATAVVPAGDGFTASVDPGWTIGSRPNGGYLLALATRAALAVTGQPHPLAVSAHFVARPTWRGTCCAAVVRSPTHVSPWSRRASRGWRSWSALAGWSGRTGPTGWPTPSLPSWHPWRSACAARPSFRAASGWPSSSISTSGSIPPRSAG